MNKHFRLFTFFLSVYLFSYAHARDDEYESRGLFESEKSRLIGLCDQRISEYNSLKKDLSSKCGGTTKNNCMIQAAECNAQGGEDSGSSGWGGALSSLLGGVMPALGGGMGQPMLGGQGAAAFKCMPKSTRDQIKKDFEKLREDAQKGKKEAQEYKREIEKDQDKLTEQIADLKKNYQEELRNAKKVKIELDAKITGARLQAEQEALQKMDEVEKIEQAKVTAMGAQEDAQSQLGSLYTDSIQPCVDLITNDSMTFKRDTYFKFKQELQAKIDQESDLTKKESIRRQGERELKSQEGFFRSELKAKYDSCLRNATSNYKTQYNRLSTTIKQLNKTINKQNIDVENLNKQIARIPEVLNQTIQGLKDDSQATSEQTLVVLQQNQQQMQTLVTNFQARYQEAQTGYNQAEQQLNMAQLSYQSNQQAFQMNTFGDAAPIVEDIDDARRLACDSCKRSVSAFAPAGLCSDSDESNRLGNQ